MWNCSLAMTAGHILAVDSIASNSSSDQVWSWASYEASLCYCFLFWKWREITAHILGLQEINIYEESAGKNDIKMPAATTLTWLDRSDFLFFSPSSMRWFYYLHNLPDITTVKSPVQCKTGHFHKGCGAQAWGRGWGWKESKCTKESFQM